MSAFIHHFTFEFKTGLRNSTALLMNYLFPLGFYAMMGAVMTQVNPAFSETLIPAVVLVAIMASSILGMPATLVETRDAGIYRSYKINGIPALSILAIPALSTAFHALIVSLIIAVTANPFFNATTPQDWTAFALLTVLSIFVFGAIGALIGVVSTSSRATVLWSQLIFLPSMLISGMMMPLDVIPESFHSVAGLLPTTYAMQSFLGLAFRQETVMDPTISAAVLAAAGVLAFSLAIYLFNWDRSNKASRGHPLMALLVLVPFLVGIWLA